jgi:hypothetical protein
LMIGTRCADGAGSIAGRTLCVLEKIGCDGRFGIRDAVLFGLAVGHR